MEFLCEYTVDRKKEGLYRLLKPLIISGWIIVPLILVIGGLAVGSINVYLSWLKGMIFVVPLLFVIMGGKFGPACAAFGDVAYEYTISSGEMSFAKIFGNRFRREWFKLKVSDMEKCAPLTSEAEEELADIKVKHFYKAISSEKAQHIYYAIFTDEKGDRCLMYFEVIKKSLKMIKTYHPSTVMTNLPF